MKLEGYMRKDGRVGFRNKVIVLPTVTCAYDIANRIGALYNKVEVLYHNAGCGQLKEDKDQSYRTLIGIAQNPNVAGVLLVGMGCEMFDASELAHEISKSKDLVETVVVDQEGGSLVDALTKGNRILQHLVEESSKLKKVECSIKDLTLGIKCGLSDTTSGLASNPATGVLADRIVEEGGTVVFSETAEVIGAEHILAKQTANEQVSKDLLKAVLGCEERVKASGVDIRDVNPSPGNIRMGLSSIEEKSLGAVKKAGSKKIQGVLKYGEAPKGKGLYFMDGPGRTPEVLASLNAAGAQAIVFSTGGGSPAGNQISPVIKVTGNIETIHNRPEHIDVDVSSIIHGKETILEAGEKIYQKLLLTLMGEVTKAEALEYGFMNIWSIDSVI